MAQTLAAGPMLPTSDLVSAVMLSIVIDSVIGAALPGARPSSRRGAVGYDRMIQPEITILPRAYHTPAETEP